MTDTMNGTGDRTIGYANCPQCERVMRRTDAKIVTDAVLVLFACPHCGPGMDVTCALTTKDNQPIRLEWFFCDIGLWQPPATSPAERARRERERLNVNQ